MVTKEDDQRITFLKELQPSAESVDLGANWRALHRCLGDGSLNVASCPPPLGDAILGGRQMQQSADTIVSMLRPDMVPVVAEALAATDEGSLRERCEALSLTWEDELSANLAAITQLYRSAASSRAAVVFFAGSFVS